MERSKEISLVNYEEKIISTAKLDANQFYSNAYNFLRSSTNPEIFKRYKIEFLQPLLAFTVPSGNLPLQPDVVLYDIEKDNSVFIVDNVFNDSHNINNMKRKCQTFSITWNLYTYFDRKNFDCPITEEEAKLFLDFIITPLTVHFQMVGIKCISLRSNLYFQMILTRVDMSVNNTIDEFKRFFGYEGNGPEEIVLGRNPQHDSRFDTLKFYDVDGLSKMEYSMLCANKDIRSKYLHDPNVKKYYMDFLKIRSVDPKLSLSQQIARDIVDTLNYYDFWIESRRKMLFGAHVDCLIFIPFKMFSVRITFDRKVMYISDMAIFCDATNSYPATKGDFNAVTISTICRKIPDYINNNMKYGIGAAGNYMVTYFKRKDENRRLKDALKLAEQKELAYQKIIREQKNKIQLAHTVLKKDTVHKRNRENDDVQAYPIDFSRCEKKQKPTLDDLANVAASHTYKTPDITELWDI